MERLATRQNECKAKHELRETLEWSHSHFIVSCRNTNPMATLSHCSNCCYDGVLFVILLLLSRTPPLTTHMFLLTRTLYLFHSHSLCFNVNVCFLPLRCCTVKKWMKTNKSIWQSLSLSFGAILPPSFYLRPVLFCVVYLCIFPFGLFDISGITH